MTRILVVDDDLSTRASIVAELARPHRAIATAGDGEEALLLAESFAPHLIITDVVMPKLDGWALLDALRARPETADIAVIFVTGLDSAAARVHGLRSGAVDFLAKPFDLDELELRVENALHYSVRSQRVAEAALAGGVAGSLGHVGLASVLNMLSLDRKSGELRVALGSREASVILRDGSIVSASFVRGRKPRGARCVYELLGWDDGRFAFIERDVAVKDDVRMSMTAILMEAARLVDEANGKGGRSERGARSKGAPDEVAFEDGFG